MRTTVHTVPGVIYDRYANEIYQHLKKSGFYDDLYEEAKDGKNG